MNKRTSEAYLRGTSCGKPAVMHAPEDMAKNMPDFGEGARDAVGPSDLLVFREERGIVRRTISIYAAEPETGRDRTGNGKLD